MIINISCPLKREEVKQLLLANEDPKFTYIRNKTPMEMQFEVTYADGNDANACNDAKRIIKSTEWGKVLNLRILEDGKKYSW